MIWRDYLDDVTVTPLFTAEMVLGKLKIDKSLVSYLIIVLRHIL